MTSQSFTLGFSPSLKTMLNSNFPGDPLPSFSAPFLKNPYSSFDGFSLKRKTLGFNDKINGFGGKFGIFSAWRKEGHLEELDDAPLAVELQQICSESQFDRVIAEAQQLEESLIILWMASWCRKCIYLKPKLEKLAADYYPRLRFYRVDVNTVPHNLVARAGVTKMPTIQLWRESKKQAEVIGGHKAYLVVNEVREMIENECTIALCSAVIGEGNATEPFCCNFSNICSSEKVKIYRFLISAFDNAIVPFFSAID